ncbi:MAG TPA: hypothetical protein VK642_12835 [Burkholderiales bacterium]|nr:hypothetical protein [Burkholderiales bacterium]
MKSVIYKVFAALTVAASLAGCGTIVQESALQWMQRQPEFLDP